MSHKALETSHSRAMASFMMPFTSLVCMHTKHALKKIAENYIFYVV